MLIGITVDKFKGIRPSLIIRLTRKIGLNFVELTKSVFEDITEVISEIGSTKTGIHLPNIVDQGYDFSCIDNENDINNLIELINKHRHSLNIQYCLTHPPECSTSNKENSSAFLFENLKKLASPVIIENITSFNQEQFNEFYAKAQVELGSQLIGICFDAPHYYVSGENPVSLLKNHDYHIRCVHLSDCIRDKDTHLPFGSGGELPIDEILLALKERNYKGVINLELLPRSAVDIKNVIHSYLMILKVFEPFKYVRTKIKIFFYAPLIQKIIKPVISKKDIQ